MKIPPVVFKFLDILLRRTVCRIVGRRISHRAGDPVRRREGCQNGRVVTDDIACAIIQNRLPAEVVLRTPDVVAFLDHRPVFKGHVLVCPVLHVDTLLDLPDEQVLPLLTACRRIAAVMEPALGAQGTFVAINNVVSQSVPHLHVHVVPRSRGDGLRGFFWPRQKYADGEQHAYGKLLREALAEG